jgi:hypothetical protein
MPLTQQEQEWMAWGAESFKGPWVAITEVFRRLHAGEDLSKDELMVDPYFVPFNINAKLIYGIMKAGLSKAILGENPSMLTIITNTKGNKIIWSAVEMAEDGVYTEFHPLKDKLGKEWDKKGAELLYDGKMEEAYHYFSDWIKKQKGLSHIDIGILKVANIQFFGAFKAAYDDAENGGKLPLMGVKMVDAVNQIMQEGWVRFYPEVNLKKLLETIGPILAMLDPVNSGLQKAFEKLPF